MSRTSGRLLLWLPVVLLISVGCGGDAPSPGRESASESAAEKRTAETEAAPVSADDLPAPELSAMDPNVRRQLSDAHRSVAERLEAGLSGADAGRAIGELGMLYHAYDLPEAARAAYDLARAHEPDARRWPYYAGMVAERRGRFDDALTLFDAAAQTRSGGTEDDLETALEWRRGRVLRELGRNRPAEERLRQAAEKAERCPAAVFELGRLALDEDRPADAVAHFERVLRLQPDAEQTFFPLGQALRRAGRADEAAVYLERSAERERSVGGRAACADPLDARLAALTTGAAAHITRGQHARFAGDLDGAIREFRRAVEVAEDDPIAHQALAKALVEKALVEKALVERAGREPGALEEAIDHYRRAVELDPDAPTLANDLGLVLLQAGRPAEVDALLGPVAAEHVGFLPARLTLAQARLALGDPAKALEHVDRALAIDPASSTARGLKARILAATGRRAEAVDEMARLLDEHPPSDPAERLRIAAALAQLGEPDRARRHLAELTENDAVDYRVKAHAHTALAALASAAGRRTEARRQLELALALDPTLQPAQDALRRLGPS